MAISVNANSIALVARNNFFKNVYSLSDSIGKLSSGLRINSSAEDSVSFSRANELASDALSLGQAVSNANDGISISQIIDNSASESINILNSIKTKVVQAGDESLDSETRGTLQSDIDKLLADMEFIVMNSKFNDQLLLTGHFVDKWFQMGENADSSFVVSMPDAHETNMGLLQSAELSLTTTGGDVNIDFYNPGTSKTLSLKGVSISYSNSAENGFGRLADLINSYKADTGLSAQAVVESTSENSISSGNTSAGFAVNGITIGSVSVSDSDSDSKLITAINAKKSEHGVTASLTNSGQLLLKTSDGRPIEVSGLGDDISVSDSEMSTYGYARIFQQGPYKLNMTDSSKGFAVAFASNLKISSDVVTTEDSTLAAGSVLGGGSTLTAGWEAGMTISGANLNGDIVTTSSTSLLAGSVLASGSIIANGSELGGSSTNAGQITTSANSLLQSGSILLSGTVIASGSYLTNDITTASGSTAAGVILTSDATLTADLTLSADMMLLSGSVIEAGSTFKAGSFIGGDFTLSGSMNLEEDMTLLAESRIVDTDSETIIYKGSTIGGTAILTAADLSVETPMMVKTGSTLSSSTELATGSSIGGITVVNGNHTASYDIFLASGSILADSSTLAAGTLLTNEMQTTEGTQNSGMVILQAQITDGPNNISNSMTLKAGSIVSNGSTLAPNTYSQANFSIGSESRLKLININVLTIDDAVASLEIVDAALSDFNDIKNEALGLQSQFESAVTSLGTTKSNLLNARSSILDIDFAEEVENMTRMQLLVNSSSFSLTQANAVPGNIFSILQGGSGQSASDFFFSIDPLGKWSSS